MGKPVQDFVITLVSKLEKNQPIDRKEWEAFFDEVNKYIRNSEVVYDDYRQSGDFAVISQCKKVLEKLYYSEAELPILKPKTSKEAMKDIEHLYKGLNSIVINFTELKRKNHAVSGIGDMLVDFSKSFNTFVKTRLLVVLIITNSETGISNAKQVDINTVLLPTDLIVNDLN